jgi:outer membrane receptor protein involved in Fe transport
MVGQAPYVVNAGLSYTSPAGTLSATMLYNVVGRRIVNASEAPLPDNYEEARQMLDFSLRFPATHGLGVKLDLRNLLDQPFEIRQGTVVREHYRSGRTIAVGLSWQP